MAFTKGQKVFASFIDGHADTKVVELTFIKQFATGRTEVEDLRGRRIITAAQVRWFDNRDTALFDLRHRVETKVEEWQEALRRVEAMK